MDYRWGTFAVAAWLTAAACSSSSMEDGGAGDAGRDGALGVDAGGDAGAPDAGADDAGPDLGPPPAGDTCADPRDAVALGTLSGDTLTLSGDNVAARTDLATCASFDPVMPLGDVVYRYDPTADGRLHWSLHATTPTRFVVDVRTTCDDPTSNLVCVDCSIDCAAALRVTAGTPLFFVVSGVRTTGTPDAMGAFDLSFRLVPDLAAGDACSPAATADDPACAPGLACVEDAAGATTCRAPACGDAYLGFTVGECEDGNATDGDGCSAACAMSSQGAGGADCAGAVTLGLPRTRWLSDTVVYLASAAGDLVAGSDVSATCAAAAGPEAVYVLDVPVRAAVQLSATGVDDVSLRPADGGCGSTELGCTAGSATASSVELALPDVAPGRYLVVLDRESPSAATGTAYTLDVFAMSL